MNLQETALEVMKRLTALDSLDYEDYRKTNSSVSEILKEYPQEVLREINRLNRAGVLFSDKEEYADELAIFIVGRMETVDNGYTEMTPSPIGEMRRKHHAEKLQIAEAKFTCGEWEYYRSFGVIVGSGNKSIAQVNDAGEDEHCCKLTEEGQANARLIAHAPDMYNLLVRVLRATTDSELRDDVLTLIWDITGKRKNSSTAMTKELRPCPFCKEVHHE